MRKNSLAILTTAILILSFLGPALFQVAAAVDPSNWYMTVPGVADSDVYSLYPFEKESLNVGFSQFGEMIDANTNVGLEYDGRDPFANDDINIQYWLNGWYLDARYIHRFHGVREFWAFAMFADGVSYGGDWINNAADQYDAPHGGRKTSGVAETMDIEVLYDGPRRFIALCRTNLNDTEGDDSWELFELSFTIIFNKVKKEVIVLKDIKLVIDSKILEGPVDVQFSNRGEWDLGPSPDWLSYAHFYHQELSTCYAEDWHMQKVILREFKYQNLSFTGDQLILMYDPPFFRPVVGLSEFVYVNGEWLKRGEDYNINYDTGVIDFFQTLDDDEVVVYYKLYKGFGDHEIMSLPHEFDLAQVIAQDEEVVGFAAFWPILSDYTVYGWDHTLTPLFNVSQPDAPPGEPQIPFVIGEWDIMLDYGVETEDWDAMFRGVTVYGVVNGHNAEDAQMGGKSMNVIDVEVEYLLEEVFNPWDLEKMVHKDTRRHVWIDDVEDLSYVVLPEENFRMAYGWEDYCVFAERILLDGELLVPDRAVASSSDYFIIKDTAGYAWVFFDELITGHLKILYSTDATTDEYLYDIMETSSNRLNVSSGDSFVRNMDISALVMDNFGTQYEAEFDIDFEILLNNNQSNWADMFSYETSMWFDEFKVFKESERFDADAEDTMEAMDVILGGEDAGLIFNMSNLGVKVYPPEGETVHVHELDVDFSFWVDVAFNESEPFDGSGYWYNITYGWMAEFEVLASIGGRQEWVAVGRDAGTADSLGAALAAAAFKNKQVEIGLGAMDFMAETDDNMIPYLLNKVGTGDTFADYFLDPDLTSPGQRLALKDDWCTYWPVSSSNI
jgi:hypothetical protein